MTLRRLLFDTNVWGAGLDRRTEALRTRYARHLVGTEPAVAAQTVAELRFGGLAAGWGPKRMAQIEDLVHRAAVIAVDDRVIWTHARLRSACRRAGHALHDNAHSGDLWIAASALAHNLPLVSDDRLFLGVPGLSVIHERPQ